MTQAHTLSGFGYEATQEGLQRYRADLHALMAATAASAPSELATLSAADKAIWEELLLRAFAVAPRPNALDADAARELVAAAAAAMQTRAFMEELDSRLGALPGGTADRAERASGAGAPRPLLGSGMKLRPSACVQVVHARRRTSTRPRRTAPRATAGCVQLQAAPPSTCSTSRSSRHERRDDRRHAPRRDRPPLGAP